MKVKNIEWDKIPKKLVYKQDCTKEITNGNYFEIGYSKVVQSDCGSYREAAFVDDSRFGYRFKLLDKSKPHLLIIKYPDDKRRFMCIQNGTTYDSTTGIMTGKEWEISGEMKTIYLPYWPRWTDDSIVFSSYGVPYENPAAVSSFEVYELESLPEVVLPEECKTVGNRTMGIQYEDPCNVGMSEGTFEFYEWLSHHIEFMKMTGQNRLDYPINWYHGPIIPVASQPHSRFNLVACEDRKMYVRSTFDTPDWLEYLLEKFDEENLHFMGTMTLMRLGNLMKAQNTDISAIAAGEDTINNVLYNGMAQTSIHDWTTQYNPIMFPEIAKNLGKPLDEYAYGEKSATDVAAPIFNPLHPEVQRQLIEYFTEIALKYAKHSSFDGISVNFWHGTFLWYGTLLAGYDDYSFKLFEKEAGIISGIEETDPERFSKRYVWMLKHCKSEFVQWRCVKIHELIIKLRDAMQNVRADLKLGLNIWNETSNFGYLQEKGHLKELAGANGKFGNRFSNYELYRESGLDLELFKEDNGIELCVEHNCARDRSSWDAGEKGIIENAHKFQDFSYLDNTLNDVLKNSKRCTGFHFDCWVELWGNFKKFNCSAEDEQNMQMIKALPDYIPEFIYRENASYSNDPDGKFFYDSQLRICSPYPAGEYFLEELTMDIALRDALSLTSGGLYLDKAHAVEKAELAKEYRKLPAVAFDDVETLGPVVVRWHFDGEKSYIYAVNREPYELPVKIKCEDGTLEEKIAPFMLKVWILNKKVVPIKAFGYAPEDVKKRYHEEAESVYKLFGKADRDAEWAKGMDFIELKMRQAQACENYADLRHLLHSYIVCKAKEESEGKEVL